ncbi:shikimate kinase [Veillonellaceae bacterium M2-4]|nr:shikimate kinase [Veillonellaceae bacterium M2-4]
MKRNIVLVGMMGSGKSHIGRKLAHHLNWQFVDTDRRIEQAEDKTIAEFYSSSGEAAFREREINILQQVSRYHEAVISFGGNFPMTIESYRILHKHGFIIALLTEPFRVEERVKRHIGKRPTVDYDNLSVFVRKMLKEWETIYPYCDAVIDTTRGGSGQIVQMITKTLRDKKVNFVKREKRRRNNETENSNSNKRW